MWRIVAVTLALIAFMSPSLVSADTGADIDVKARAYIAGAPQGFTVTWVSDTDILLTWTTGADAVNTMVRAKYGSYPTDITDGYLVYEGPAESYHDTSMNLDETASLIYYRAWSQNAAGVWTLYDESSGGFIGGAWVLLIMLALIPVALTWSMFQSKSAMLGFPCAIFWAIFGGAAYQESTVVWDVYYLLFFGAFGMVIFTMFAAYGLRTKKEEAKEGDLFLDEGGDKDVKFIDEGKDEGEREYAPNRRAGVRERAARRRARWA